MLRHPSICPQSPALLSAPSRCGGQKIHLCGPADELLRASICLCQRGPDKSRRAPRTRLRSKSKISAVFTDGDYEPRVSEVRLCSESLGYKCLSIAHTPGRLSALTWGRPAEGGGRGKMQPFVASLCDRHPLAEWSHLSGSSAMQS